MLSGFEPYPGWVPLAQPFPTPGLLRGICKFCAAGGRAFANPGAIPELLIGTRFPVRI